MKISSSVLSVILLIGGVAFADVNGAPVTTKGHYAFYVDHQPWFSQQAQGDPGAKPAVTSVTRIGVLYGFADLQEVGLVRIDDTYVFPAASAERVYTAPDLGFTYAYEISKLFPVGFDLRFQFEYDLPRLSVAHVNGQSPADDNAWRTGATYYGLAGSKELSVRGLYAGGFVGVMNIWNKNLNSAYEINEQGASAYMIGAGLDYVVPNTTFTLYTTVGHMDNNDLVGKEDAIGVKARNNKADYITAGLRYDI